MARTLIWNTSAIAQTLPAAYGSQVVQPGYGWIVSDESSVAVTALGGFADMHGKWAVSAISTDEALGSVDMGAAGVALIEDVVAAIGGGGGGGGGGGPVAWADVTGKPTFATVATSGQYADLSNKPALADVATSGLYSDLSGTPSLPSASNDVATDVSVTGAAGVLNTYARADHQHAHGNQNGGSLHSAATTLSAGFMSAADKVKLDGLENFSGDYNDLSNKPTLFSGAYADLSGKPALANVATSGAYADLSGTPSLADVATSGAYADLSGTPSLAAVATSGSANDLTDQPYDLMVSSPGNLVLNQVLMRGLAPRNLILTQLQQGGEAVVQIKINGVAASYPQSVSAGALITAVVTTAGLDNYFTVTGKVA